MFFQHHIPARHRSPRQGQNSSQENLSSFFFTGQLEKFPVVLWTTVLPGRAAPARHGGTSGVSNPSTVEAEGGVQGRRGDCV